MLYKYGKCKRFLGSYKIKLGRFINILGHFDKTTISFALVGYEMIDSQDNIYNLAITSYPTPARGIIV